MTIRFPFPSIRSPWLVDLAFIVLYVLLDWVSYIDPLFGLNITPWNPDPALGLVYWVRYGKRAALPWFAALVLAEAVVRGMPAGLFGTLVLSAWLVFGYGTVGAILRRVFSDASLVNKRERLYAWLAVVVPGLLLNGLVYIGLLGLTAHIPLAELGKAMVRFGIGDTVGVVVSMPLLWMLASADGRRRLLAVLVNWETAAYAALAVGVLWTAFYGMGGNDEFKHFYLLFLPIIWAATRQGLPGTGLIAFGLQFGIICIVRWGGVEDIPFSELQLLGAALALVGFFIGVTVDEQRQAAEELKHTLRLATAGEMAGALAHELNQPLTALAAYGKACEVLMARGDTGLILSESIRKMVQEAGRAADVVRRLREFFRTGAMRLEAVDVADIVRDLGGQFEQQFQQHGVQLHAGGLPGATIRVDRLQIELVLRNLIANAYDAVLQQPAGFRRIAVSAARLDGARLRISVQDSGPGVTEAVAARLFEPFVSGKSSGLGLGLVLSRAIVEAHGGSLWAEVAGQGIFRFVLPLAETGDEHGR